MQTFFPTQTGFSGMFLVGFRRHPLGGGAQKIGSLLIKRKYVINGTSLTPQDDPDGIRFSDQLVDVDFGGETFTLTDIENDLSVYKPKADLIVRGSYSPSNAYSASVTNPGQSEEIWMERDVPTILSPLTDADAATNMFGWEQRWFDTREDLAEIPPLNPGETEPDFSNFDNQFFNAFRRSFTKAGFPLQQFEAGATVTLRKTLDGETESTIVSTFDLGNESFLAKLYFHHKHQIDKKVHWCSRRIEDIRLDTLVITPAENLVYAIWRGNWDFDEFLQEDYRMLKVAIEEAN